MPYKNHDEQIKKGRLYYRKNKEYIKKRERDKYWNEHATIRKRRKELWVGERRAKETERMRLTYAAYRNIVINAYGGACACCGESERLFLEIDHINNNGTEHRKIIGTGAHKMVVWLLKNNFPDGFQILCANCNQGKRRNGGVCPHKKNEQ